LIDCKERSFPAAKGANACFTLSPSVPEANLYHQQYFVPFTRFGRHGDRLARSKNPFKVPVVMADEGAVFVPCEQKVFSRPYLGRAIHDVSLVQFNAVAQGYSIYLPCEVAI
jgi:CRISPR-associated protein Csm4